MYPMLVIFNLFISLILKARGGNAFYQLITLSLFSAPSMRLLQTASGVLTVKVNSVSHTDALSSLIMGCKVLLCLDSPLFRVWSSFSPSVPFLAVLYFFCGSSESG